MVTGGDSHSATPAWGDAFRARAWGVNRGHRGVVFVCSFLGFVNLFLTLLVQVPRRSGGVRLWSLDRSVVPTSGQRFGKAQDLSLVLSRVRFGDRGMIPAPGTPRIHHCRPLPLATRHMPPSAAYHNISAPDAPHLHHMPYTFRYGCRCSSCASSSRLAAQKIVE